MFASPFFLICNSPLLVRNFTYVSCLITSLFFHFAVRQAARDGGAKDADPAADAGAGEEEPGQSDRQQQTGHTGMHPGGNQHQEAAGRADPGGRRGKLACHPYSIYPTTICY